MHKKVILIVCDGWGVAPPTPGNAIALARTPHFNLLKSMSHYTTLKTSDESVGLPFGQVGHLNLGAGRIVYQDLLIINKAIQDGSFYRKPVLLDALKKAKKGSLHLMGLLSNGGVHSDMEHVKALITAAIKAGVSDIKLDVYLDGRDTEPKSALRFIQEIKEFTDGYQTASISTISGRFYGMDRDQRWERVQKSYEAILGREGKRFENPEEALLDAYNRSETDEFVTPCIINSKHSKPMTSEDVMIFFNYRADRTREITRAFTQKDFTGFDRGPSFPMPFYYCLTPYDESFDLPILFPRETIKNTVGQVLSDHGLKQLRIAETEKYAHVTFFFNGGREAPFPGEERILIPSPKVPTYDLQPEMSAPLVLEKLLAQVDKNYDFILLNFANLDMVGHTGIISSTIQAVETIDFCLGRLYKEFNRAGYDLIITADHGNAEQMLDEAGNVQTAHSRNPVPFLYLPFQPNQCKLLEGCFLRDVADLVLHILEIPKPSEMKESRILA